RNTDALRELQASVASWQKVAEVAGRLYVNPVQFWQSRMVSPVPWNPDQLHAGYQLVEGHWRDLQLLFERELKLIQSEVEQNFRKSNLPLWDQITAASDSLLRVQSKITFESAVDRGYHLGQAAALTTNRELVMSGSVSLLADTTSLEDGWHTVFITDPDEI